MFNSKKYQRSSSLTLASPKSQPQTQNRKNRRMTAMSFGKTSLRKYTWSSVTKGHRRKIPSIFTTVRRSTFNIGMFSNRSNRRLKFSLVTYIT